MPIPDYRRFQHSNELYHYGMPRRSGRYPWGSGERPYQSIEGKTISGVKTPNELSDLMKNFSYSDYSKLQSPEETFKKKSGSCHDQVMFELEELSKMGLNPKAEFLIEYNSKNGQGGTTHSFVYYENKGRVYWFENAWSGKEGIHEFDDLEGIKNFIREEHKKGGFGENNKFPKLEFSNFGKHKPGETLQELVDKSLDEENVETNSEILDKMEDLKHFQESEVNFKMSNIYYLSHGGPGSGRYPLGSGERPYQKFEGTGRSVRGIRGYIQSRRAKKAEEKEQQARNEELRKRMEEGQKKRQHDMDKERVLREGTAIEVMKYQGELTNQELQNVVNRLNLESQLRNLSEKETKTAIDKMDGIMKTVKTGTEWAKIGTDTYNTIASIYNATPEGQKSPLTLVRKDDSSKRK